MHADVTASYMGLPLPSPLIVGACPMTLATDTVRELTIAGAGAVVLPSPTQSACESITRSAEARDGFDRYLGAIAALKRITGIPIIASISGCIDRGWLDLARQIEAHGADAIELSLQTDTSDRSLAAGAIESALIERVASLCQAASIPVSIKLMPFFTSLPNLAWRLAEAGAKGVAIFGREPVWQVVESQMTPSSHWSLSDSSQLQTTLSGLVRLRAGGLQISVAGSGGISTARDVFDVVIAGADVAMVTSEIYRTGPDAIAHLLEGIVSYLLRRHFDSFKSFVEATRANAPGQFIDGRAPTAH